MATARKKMTKEELVRFQKAMKAMRLFGEMLMRREHL